ncbi:hypothetical protein CAPTEDRAFT_142220 [Capitella teleta]|uniref:Fucosyltransferase n=1 Tax=Capitella teleta TaxID=283909 RepID=R7U8U1_CAPTE|nr:hypothetical protein CAPTEDRAFT_142220 [Capitella teleta]|eukprot:ELU02780.1 hypothetical protein CAPTEDRAFT_142220 [Capitella teleta]
MDSFRPQSLIRILSWTPISKFSQSPWYSEGSSIFGSCRFDPPLKCEYTHDRSLLLVSDAVIFRGMMLDQALPSRRLAHQKWVLFESKPPRLVLTNLSAHSEVFNLTSTFSMDSDVPLPMQRKCTPVKGQNNVRSYPGENFAIKKSRMLAWINVNHCATPSRREYYVQDLRKHVDVHIYGQCGEYRCRDGMHKCLRRIAPKYKFILAFENALCSDYITDALWSIFDNRLKVVPIVLGAADYSSVLPEGTYIDVRNFTSPRALAKYLKYLDRHPDQYNGFINRRNFDVCSLKTDYSQYHCALCKHLHEYRGVSEVALNVATFWGRKRRCQKPTRFYKKIAPKMIKANTSLNLWGDPSWRMY